jgi:hypothetical protein
MLIQQDFVLVSSRRSCFSLVQTRIHVKSFSADVVASVLEAWNRTGRSVGPSPKEAISRVSGNGRPVNVLHSTFFREMGQLSRLRSPWLETGTKY